MAEIKVIVTKHCHKIDVSHLENIVLTSALVSGYFCDRLTLVSASFTNIIQTLMNISLWLTCEIRANYHPNFRVKEMRY